MTDDSFEFFFSNLVIYKTPPSIPFIHSNALRYNSAPSQRAKTKGIKDEMNVTGLTEM
jgi:hypothetical protein